jgi:hypothetical protein
MNTLHSCLLLTLFASVAGRALADPPRPAGTVVVGNKAHPGEFVVEPTTLINAGFEWYVDGDANHNATVTVHYRPAHSGAAWRQGMNLLRIQNEVAIVPPYYTYVAPNMFAGSIFDLQPNTEYEAQFTMSDPDGVTGDRTRTVHFRTQAEPVPYTGSDAHVYHVYPPGTDLTKVPTAPNAYPGILGAYYMCQVEDDWNKMCAVRVKPGDTILVHAGTYVDDRYHYSGTNFSEATKLFNGGQGTDFDGTYYLRANGTKEKPIVIKAAGDGPVIIDGNNNHVLFDVQSADYNYFEGLTFQNTDVAILAGTKGLAGATGLTVKRSIFRNIAAGIWTEWPKSKWFYIADNYFYGRNETNYQTAWGGAVFGALWQQHVANGTAETTPVTVQPVAGGPANDKNQATYQAPNIAYFATKLYGSGHTVAYNYAAYFHDGFDFDTHFPEGYPCPECGPSNQPRELMAVSNDTYNNDMNDMSDNCGEEDGSTMNARWMRNRCINTGEQATSNQPTFAGPQYYIRNVLYNTFTNSIKWNHPQGVIYLNNTFTNHASGSGGANVHFLNNLILDPIPGNPILSVGMYTNYSTLDYNGYAPTPATGDAPLPPQFSYTSPADPTVLADYSSESPGGTPLVTHTYGSLAEYQAGTGQDKHSILVDWTDFVNAQPPNEVSDPERLYSWGTITAGVTSPVVIDLTLKPGAKAIDKGVFIPNVTDDFTGNAPDLGAYEYGQPVPVYGPRWSP